MMVYGVSIIGTVPFMKLSFFEGYFATLIGADVSWIPGLALAGLLYFTFNVNRVRHGSDRPYRLNARFHKR